MHVLMMRRAIERVNRLSAAADNGSMWRRRSAETEPRVRLDFDAMNPVLDRAGLLSRAELDELGRIRDEQLYSSALGSSQLDRAEREARRVAGEVRAMVASSAADIALDKIAGAKAPRSLLTYVVQEIRRSMGKPSGGTAIANALLAAGLGDELHPEVAETILGPWHAVVGDPAPRADVAPP